MKGLYKMEADCCYGILYGLFIADIDKINCLINHNIDIYFGEVLGKYSEVEFSINDYITLISVDENVIKIVEDNKLETGYNPLNETVYEKNELDNDTVHMNKDFKYRWDDYPLEYYIDYLMTGQLPKDF